MISVHRKQSADNKGFISMVIDRFGQDVGRLQLLFVSDANKCCQVN